MSRDRPTPASIRCPWKEPRYDPGRQAVRVHPDAHYYLIADRGAKGPAFLDISNTRHIFVNHRTPAQVKAILPPMYVDYVQAEAPNARIPTIRATFSRSRPAGRADQIAAVIRSLDLPRRQVCWMPASS